MVQWTSATRQAYFKESSARDFDNHESLHTSMRPNGVDLRDCLTLYTNTEKLDASEAWYECLRSAVLLLIKHSDSESLLKFDKYIFPQVLSKVQRPHRGNQKV